MARVRTLPLGRVRPARRDDTPRIAEMVTEPVARTFRIDDPERITYLIENCILAICQLDPDEKIVAFLVVRDFPLIPCLHPSAWEQYLWAKYKTVELNARNTLFIHMLCWDPDHSRPAVDNMMRSIFMHDMFVYYIAMVKSVPQFPLLDPIKPRAEASFKRVQVNERGVNSDKMPVLFIAERSEVCPRMKIRRAVEEDSDDIIPIFERQSERLHDLYGDFYISELIARHPESDRVLIVAEHKEVAIGVMCLNTQINFEALEESFLLSPFSGLRRDCACKRKSTDSPVRQESELSQGNFQPSSKKCKPKEQHPVFKKEAGASIDFVSVFEFTQDKYLDTLLALEDQCDYEDEDYTILNIDYEKILIPYVNEYKLQIKYLRQQANLEDDVPYYKMEEDLSFIRPIPPKCERYTGPPNAFLLELFAVHESYDERYGFDMLEASFEMFPDRDYCVLCLPSHVPPFPLLEYFTAVSPTKYRTRMRFTNESLYVAHVNSVHGAVHVRRGEISDTKHLMDVLENVPRMESLIDMFKSSINSTVEDAFVLLSQNQPIGLVIIDQFQDSVDVRKQFDLDPEARTYGSDGLIRAAVLSPVFHPHCRWFLREFMRFTQYSTLFWIGTQLDTGEQRTFHQLMTLTGSMCPVNPRSPFFTFKDGQKVDNTEQTNPFSLWMIERPLTTTKTLNVNSHIVVVGASQTGLAFLRALIMGPTSQYLFFTNLTLISEHGIPTSTHSLKAAVTCMTRRDTYHGHFLKSLPYFYYVDVISGIMVGIDRKKKCIFLKGGEIKFYDDLIITVGHQFQHPDYLRDELELVTQIGKGKPCDRKQFDDHTYLPDRLPYLPELPLNVMLINSIHDANECLKKLACMMSKPKNANGAVLSDKNPVVVYGDCLEAYSCLAALLEFGVAPQELMFVEPFPADDPTKMRVNCFNNETIDGRVQASIESLGIHVMRQCYMTGMNQRQKFVHSINLMQLYTATTLNCFALFYFGMKAINLYAFRAINKCGLVYDGGLIVNPSFETNDPSIFAAGTCTKYSRRLYADHMLQKYFSSAEVGEALAEYWIERLNPFSMNLLAQNSASLIDSPEQSTNRLTAMTSMDRVLFKAGGLKSQTQTRKWEPVPYFKCPILEAATLPGPLHYVKVRKPGMEIPMAVMKSSPHQGHILITDKDKNFFRVHLSNLHVITNVVCLSHFEFCPYTVTTLYGKHEACFNKMMHRYLTKDIDDFYKFFTQPWTPVLYHDSYKDILESIFYHDIRPSLEHILSLAPKSSEYNADTDSSYDSSFYSADSFEMYWGFLFSSVFSCEIPLHVKSSSFDLNYVRQLLTRTLKGTLRSIMDTLFTDTFKGVTTSERFNVEQLEALSYIYEELPSECGHSLMVRLRALDFWKHLDGERIVLTHLAEYLEKYFINCPQYCPIKPDCIDPEKHNDK